MTTGTFPAAPTNGQTTEVGGRYYVYNSTIGGWENVGGLSASPTVASITATANVNVTANVNAGNLIASGSITGALLDIDNIRLDVNTISTLNTNGNLNLTPNGTGTVVVPNLRISTTLSFSDSTTQTTAGVSPGRAIAMALVFG